jgi:hypothetical protein
VTEADDDNDKSENLGPALAACSPMERKFVRALFDDSGGRGVYARAAKAAGYSDKSVAGLSRAANKLRHRPHVVSAIAEMAKAEIRQRAPLAVKTVMDVMRRGEPADRLRAARTVLERVDPTEQRVSLDVHVNDANKDDLAVKYLKELILMGTPREGLVRFFGFSGLPRYETMLREKCAREGQPYPTSKVITHAPRAERPEGDAP